MNQFIKIERNFWNSNTAMLVGIIQQKQKFIPIDEVGCKYKKTTNKLKRLFGDNVPNFFVLNDMLVVVSVRQHLFKGHLYENVLVTPMAQCKGKFKKYQLNWNDNESYRRYERKTKSKLNQN